MHNLKGYVRNKARPEGSIAEGYIDKECLTFCSMYLNDMETIFNRPERNCEYAGPESSSVFPIFNHKARGLGGHTVEDLNIIEWATLRWYVLNNCAEVIPYLK